MLVAIVVCSLVNLIVVVANFVEFPILIPASLSSTVYGSVVNVTGFSCNLLLRLIFYQCFTMLGCTVTSVVCSRTKV